MTERQQQIAVAVFKVLKRMPQGVCAEGILFESVKLYLKERGEETTRAEFEEVICECESNRWVTGMHSALGTRKWAITDGGRILENL